MHTPVLHHQSCALRVGVCTLKAGYDFRLSSATLSSGTMYVLNIGVPMCSLFDVQDPPWKLQLNSDTWSKILSPSAHSRSLSSTSLTCTHVCRGEEALHKSAPKTWSPCCVLSENTLSTVRNSDRSCDTTSNEEKDSSPTFEAPSSFFASRNAASWLSKLLRTNTCNSRKIRAAQSSHARLHV